MKANHNQAKLVASELKRITGLDVVQLNVKGALYRLDCTMSSPLLPYDADCARYISDYAKGLGAKVKAWNGIVEFNW